MEENVVEYRPGTCYCGVDNTPCNGLCRKFNGSGCSEKISERVALGEKGFRRKHGIKYQREERY